MVHGGDKPPAGALRARRVSFRSAAYQSVDDPNDITAWHDFASLDEAQAFVSSARLREVMAEAGVAREPNVWFATEV